MRLMFAMVFFLCLLPSSSRAQSAARQQSPSPTYSWFLTQSVRILGTLGHTHVGASTEFGARLGPIKLGILTLYRPASWSSGRIEYQLPAGRTYKGQSTLRFGEQYGTFGLFVAPRWAALSWLSFELPVSGGIAFLGTPLMGSDRETPDGRRVSDWENELTNDADVAFGGFVELGARVRIRPFEAPWFHVAVGGHYTFLMGMSNPINEGRRLSGPSGSFSLVFEP